MLGSTSAYTSNMVDEICTIPHYHVNYIHSGYATHVTNFLSSTSSAVFTKQTGEVITTITIEDEFILPPLFRKFAKR
jgi:hypothetical protein